MRKSKTFIDWAPTEIIIPFEMGFPVIIKLQMPAVVSAHGELNIECSSVIPSISFDITHKSEASLTGYVGTICPITFDLIATGIEEQFTYNYPTKMIAEVKKGKLNVVFRKTDTLKSSTQEVDLWSYRITPYTTIKPFTFVNGIPLIQHPGTKTIKSQSEEKSVVETFGLDLKLKIKSESSLMNTEGMLDYFSLYNYNPLNMALFSWTNGAINRKGHPSCRNHEIKLVYNPSRSQTNEVDIEVSLDVALKSKGSSPRILKISQQHQQWQQQQNQQVQSQQQQNQQQQNNHNSSKTNQQQQNQQQQNQPQQN